MTASNPPQYTIPARYRKMENMHILFWLIKDLSWCMIWQVLGILMIFPTLIISIIIAWRTRRMASELAHNLAVTFWITANSYWMISEFWGFDEAEIWKGIEGRHIAVIPFVIGLLFLLNFYLFRRKRNDEAEVSTL